MSFLGICIVDFDALVHAEGYETARDVYERLKAEGALLAGGAWWPNGGCRTAPTRVRVKADRFQAVLDEFRADHVEAELSGEIPSPDFGGGYPGAGP